MSLSKWNFLVEGLEEGEDKRRRLWRTKFENFSLHVKKIDITK